MRDDCITITLGLPEVRVLREEEGEHEILVEVQYRVARAECPDCGQETRTVHDRRRQWKRDRRLRDKPVWLLLHKRRFRCGACGTVFSEPNPVFGSRRRSSQRFRAYLGQEALQQTIRHLAQREEVGEGLVRRCVTELAQTLLGTPAQAPPVRILGLDEFSIKKGQVYDTALMDLERKQVVGVVSGHRQAEVQQFLETLPAPEQVVAVVMDMHEPFRQAVQFCLPQAKVVADKFHVLAHVHRALDQVRTSLQPQQGKRGELFRARYLLLAAAERLTLEQRARLEGLLARYPTLARAWALKESFRQWYASPDRATATERLEAWEAEVRGQGPAPFQRLFSMLRDWRQEILNYFEHRYTNGFVEGKNNRIKVIKRLAYGYRNAQNFRQRILLTNVRVGEPRAA
ncbi:MAG TPA: ISL3 family transposase [Dehalococcoidia bacterium]|nr:ISL3 family transposase [Dehalococcoidia bacterium]